MPDTDQPARPPTAARPSLMGAPETPTRASATTDAGRMRMLDELEAVVRPRAVERSTAPSNWLIGLLAFGVVLGGLLWWTQHRAAEKARPVAAVPAKEAVAPVTTPPAASAPAVIETVAAAVPPAALPETSASVSVALAAASANAPDPAAPATVAAPSVARAVARPAAAPARPIAAPANDAKVTTVTTASGGKWTVTVADASAPPSAAADKPLPSPASAVAVPVPARASPASKGDDADVRLLTALLAHVARPAPGANLADEDQLTIAQVVKRCDARPAAEVRECRRRICEGYWGKAEACPAAAAKKG